MFNIITFAENFAHSKTEKSWRQTHQTWIRLSFSSLLFSLSLSLSVCLCLFHTIDLCYEPSVLAFRFVFYLFHYNEATFYLFPFCLLSISKALHLSPSLFHTIDMCHEPSVLVYGFVFYLSFIITQPHSTHVQFSVFCLSQNPSISLSLSMYQNIVSVYPCIFYLSKKKKL